MTCQLVLILVRSDFGGVVTDSDSFEALRSEIQELREELAAVRKELDSIQIDPDLGALRSRAEALCAKRPLYPGFRGFTTYSA